MSSTHKVEVVRIKELLPHPNADKLSIVQPFGSSGFQVIVKTSDWVPGALAAYVQPDSLVPLDDARFSWLRDARTPKVIGTKQYHLVRTVKLRKAQSMGLLVPVPEDSHLSPGDDIAGLLGILHYEPPQRDSGGGGAKMFGSQAEPAPSCKPPLYDLENLRRYTDCLPEGTLVEYTEKIHGANARYVAEDRGLFSWSWRNWQLSIRVGSRVFSWTRARGAKFVRLPDSARFMRVGSRTQWKRPDPNDVWWRALTPEISAFCKAHPEWVLYGEVYGDVQDLDYGVPAGQVRFIAFDIRDDEGYWLDPAAFRRLCWRYSIPAVPVVHQGAFELAEALALAEGPSILGGDHTREGVVVKPLQPRTDSRFGRIAMKIVGQGYYDRKAA